MRTKRRTAKKPANKTVSIAQVGAFDPFSDADGYRALVASEYLIKLRKPKHDIVNLIYGRDFLAEPHEYDVVVLHSIYDPGPAPPTLYAYFHVSPLHDYDRWRARLVSTRAKYLFLFEGLPCCLHGWRIGHLPGYKTIRLDQDVAVYERE